MENKSGIIRPPFGEGLARRHGPSLSAAIKITRCHRGLPASAALPLTPIKTDLYFTATYRCINSQMRCANHL